MNTRVHSFLCIEGENQARGASILHLYLNMSFLTKFRIPYLCPPLDARSRKNYQNQLEIESFEEDHNVAGHYLLCRTGKTSLSVQLNRQIQRE